MRVGLVMFFILSWNEFDVIAVIAIRSVIWDYTTYCMTALTQNSFRIIVTVNDRLGWLLKS